MSFLEAIKRADKQEDPQRVGVCGEGGFLDEQGAPCVKEHVVRFGEAKQQPLCLRPQRVRHDAGLAWGVNLIGAARCGPAWPVAWAGRTSHPATVGVTVGT